jgi:hypothetical protein
VRALIVMPIAIQRGGAEAQLQQLVQHRHEARLEPTVAFLQPRAMVDWCRQQGCARRWSTRGAPATLGCSAGPSES